jgi:hypothetical protein
VGGGLVVHDRDEVLHRLDAMGARQKTGVRLDLVLSGPWAGRPPGLPETPFGKGRPLGLALGLPVVILLKLALPLLRYQQTWRRIWGCQ